ncbi:MAG: 23S rRNA (uracil(1939)-C(5))-methyltransferase RlmD [Lachnospiraceae bacterium]|jgi:23S rRNA (uracil-5-)-methyltransferase RumA|nr:23S rRNA (uracil(1939)-C(5))-methyltransferase RlmD [Lachnospiraceae bacterium]
MKKGEILEGIVTKTSFGAKGMVEAEGRLVAVKDALPGQTVRFSVSKLRGGRAEGRLLEVLSPSDREEPGRACRHFGICGGCVYQTLPYEDQLLLKQEQVRELLKPVLSEVPMEPIQASPRILGYRNKMEYSFGDEEKGGRLSLGLHKKASFYDIVTVDGCRIADEDFASLVSATRDYFERAGVSFYHKIRHRGYLRHLLVRKATKTGQILVSLVTSSQVLEEGFWGQQGQEDEAALLAGWKDILLGLKLEGRFAGILHTVNDSLADVIQNDRTEVLYGQEYFYEELLGLRFRITPFSFFQTNSLGAEVLYEKVREYVGGTEGKVIFDLYSGTGTIAQILAPVARQVTGVELIEEAVEAARENARMNGLSNCRFLAGDVLRVLDELTQKPDLIVLDPPRDGIHPKALPKIIAYGVEKIVYVSCKPTSLARDLPAFLAGGYQVERMCAVDMFPGTAGVESIVLLSKLKSNKLKHINVELELDELDLTAAESKATYEEIKDYVLKQSGLKVSNLYIAQVKQKCGIIERANYNLPKSENSRQPKCPPEKEAAIRVALEHFKMIQ